MDIFFWPIYWVYDYFPEGIKGGASTGSNILMVSIFSSIFALLMVPVIIILSLLALLIIDLAADRISGKLKKSGHGKDVATIASLAEKSVAWRVRFSQWRNRGWVKFVDSKGAPGPTVGRAGGGNLNKNRSGNAFSAIFSWIKATIVLPFEFVKIDLRPIFLYILTGSIWVVISPSFQWSTTVEWMIDSPWLSIAGFGLLFTVIGLVFTHGLTDDRRARNKLRRKNVARNAERLNEIASEVRLLLPLVDEAVDRVARIFPYQIRSALEENSNNNLSISGWSVVEGRTSDKFSGIPDYAVMWVTVERFAKALLPIYQKILNREIDIENFSEILKSNVEEGYMRYHLDQSDGGKFLDLYYSAPKKARFFLYNFSGEYPLKPFLASDVAVRKALSVAKEKFAGVVQNGKACESGEGPKGAQKENVQKEVDSQCDDFYRKIWEISEFKAEAICFLESVEISRQPKGLFQRIFSRVGD